jgi:uncharacterized membrane protein YbhN (UPF0104 family)
VKTLENRTPRDNQLYESPFFSSLLGQGFDLYTVGFLAAAPGIAWYLHGGAKTRALCASAAFLLALLAAEPSVRIIRWLAASWKAPAAGPFNRILLSVWELQHSGILNAGLARRLVVFSTLRFVTVVLMSTETAEAIGLHISIWQMAAAIPFVVFATVIAVTPGGIGPIELACAGALAVFGRPLAVGAQWALANRVLVTVSYIFVATVAAILLLCRKVCSHDSRDSAHAHFN